MYNKNIIAISLILLSGVVLYFNYVPSAVAVQQYDYPIGPVPQTIGVSTILGCLPTAFNDEDLIKNKVLFEKVIGTRVADLCYLNG